MPGDVRYAPYVNMAPHDAVPPRPVGFRPHRLATGGMALHQHQIQHHQQQQAHHQQQQQQHHPQHQRLQSPAFYQGTRVPVGGHQMVSTTPVYAMDGHSNSSHGWDYSSPGYMYYTPPASNGSLARPVVNPMIPPHAMVPQTRYVPGPPLVSAVPPRLPDRRIVPYNHPARGFWVDQFASVDVSRQEPLPQDWHPFAETFQEPPVAQPAVTGGVMAILDYDLKVMAEFVANVSCNFINIRKPWDALVSFVERVLNQTRLPSSTVILGITYLAQRLAFETPLFDAAPDAPLVPMNQLYEYLTISLILANKFLDDNTFTNTSWSDISGILRNDLNVSERDWLKKLGYSIHLNPLEQKGWSTWSKAWETWEFEATGKTTSSLLTPVLSRSNSAVSSPQCNAGLASPLPSTFPSSSAGWNPKTKSTAAAYLTPPISPTFDTSLDTDISPITPPTNFQWPPSKPVYHHNQNQVSWRPLPNTRNIPVGAYQYLPVLPQQFHHHPASHFWEPEKGTGSPWCECTVCLTHVTLDHNAPRPTWVGMAG